MLNGVEKHRSFVEINCIVQYNYCIDTDKSERQTIMIQTPLTDHELSRLIDRLVPIVAAPADEEVFRFVLSEAAKSEPTFFLNFCKQCLDVCVS
jgi:hypothetical protein